MTNTPLFRDSGNLDQDQFLTILTREEALERFEAALFPRAVASERIALSEAVGRALASGADRCAAVRSFQCRRFRGAIR